MIRDEIIELEEFLREAMLESNVEKLDRLIDESLVFTLPTGDLITKQMDLNSHRSGIQKLTQLDPSDQKIVMHDEVAIVTVKMRMAGSYNNNPFAGVYDYTRVWKKMNKGWRIIAGHASTAGTV